MTKKTSVKNIGMHRASALANLSETKQLDLIAEGLPILMRSADKLIEASKTLTQHPRSAAMLLRHADEEIAKILILIDLVRCPKPLRSSRVKAMIKWFYSHLARLSYIEAQYLKPRHMLELQEYINNYRRSHYLEGAMGEYIMPNWEIYRRESDMYADVESYETGELFWNDPEGAYQDDKFKPNFNFQSWSICKALQNIGVFTRQGLTLTADAWSQVDFCKDENSGDAKDLTRDMCCALEKASLMSNNANESQLGILYHSWQMPMYRLDFSPIEVTLEELQAEQKSILISEIG